MNTYTCTIALGLALLGSTTLASADQLAMLDKHEAWQNNILLEPSAAQLRQELKGRVVIYDGLSDVTVDKALDAQFNRIQNMMFTRIVRTDKNGQPLKDESGSVVVEDDGC